MVEASRGSDACRIEGPALSLTRLVDLDLVGLVVKEPVAGLAVRCALVDDVVEGLPAVGAGARGGDREAVATSVAAAVADLLASAVNVVAVVAAALVAVALGSLNGTGESEDRDESELEHREFRKRTVVSCVESMGCQSAVVSCW